MPVKSITNENGQTVQIAYIRSDEHPDLPMKFGYAQCDGEKATKARLMKFKTANAASEAMQIDPKTIRKLEGGGPVRLKLIQAYAGYLDISILSILWEEYFYLVKSRVVLDYTNERLFHNSPLLINGDTHLPQVDGCALGQPCNTDKFLELLSKLSVQNSYIPGMPIPAPVWKMHETADISEDLPFILQELNDAMNDYILADKLDLTSIIETLKARACFADILTRLGVIHGCHLLGCIISTAATYRENGQQYYPEVSIPLFLIASDEIREFDLKYNKVLCRKEVKYQYSLSKEDRQYRLLQRTGEFMWLSNNDYEDEDEGVLKGKST